MNKGASPRQGWAGVVSSSSRAASGQFRPRTLGSDGTLRVGGGDAARRGVRGGLDRLMPNVDPFSVCSALSYPGVREGRGSRSGSSAQRLGGASVMERHGRDMRLGASFVDRR
jgi:hypothetical protein